jgi:hypothetical protein
MVIKVGFFAVSKEKICVDSLDITTTYGERIRDVVLKSWHSQGRDTIGSPRTAEVARYDPLLLQQSRHIVGFGCRSPSSMPGCVVPATA